MNSFSTLDSLLKDQSAEGVADNDNEIFAFAKGIALMENVIVVVSDLVRNRSYIFSGKFAKVLGLSEYSQENSIWEHRLLSLMTDYDREEKFIAELRFLNTLRHRKDKGRYYLMSKLRMHSASGDYINVLHRMYYYYSNGTHALRYAVCLYGPLSTHFSGQSIIVDSLTGSTEELTTSADKSLLSKREKEVLALIDSGLKSAEIGERLNISIHTVSRHRQEILSKLNVKNSIEACRIAKTLHLLPSF